jgi:hypothetical protein
MQSNSFSREGPRNYERVYAVPTANTVLTTSFLSDFNLLKNHTGTPNSPTVNEFKWTRSNRTTFAGSVELYRFPFGSQTLDQKWTGINVNHNSLPVPSNVDSDGTAERLALSRLYAKLRDSKASLAVDIAQGGQTYRMISSSVDRVLTFARKLKRQPMAELSKAWLEYQYGWRPALQTMYEVANHVRNNCLSRVVKGYGHEQVPISDSYALGGGPLTVSRRGSYTLHCTFGCRLNIKNNTLYDLQRFTTLNPASIAWELVPYSFVVDWFYDVGNYLTDLETAVSMGHLVSNVFVTWHTVRLENHVIDDDYVGYILDLGNTQGRNVTKSSAFLENTFHHRVPLIGLPNPISPRFDAHLGASRVLSGAALLAQNYRR